MHFPANPKCGFDARYFEGLVIEICKMDKPLPYFIKKNVRDRNEPLDLSVLNLTAKEMANPNWRKVRAWLETEPPNDWRPDHERRKEELAALPIPDLRDSTSGVAHQDVDMQALRARLVEKSKRGEFSKLFPTTPSWMKNIGK
jgi:hypothetical protein